MLIEATANDFDAILSGIAPRNLRLVPDSVIAPPEVLDMLRNLADEIRTRFEPSAWLIVSEGELIGLCSVTRVPEGGDVHIGYGVAPTRQGRGLATKAVSEILSWALNDPRVSQISAKTGIENVASQRVLERNGFVRIGERIDDEDGPVICWHAITK